MLPRRVLGIALFAGLLALAVGQAQETPTQSPGTGPSQPYPPGVEAPKVPVVKLAVPKEQKPGRALKYRLWPDPLDQVSGNAAPLWMRAGMAARLVKHPYKEEEE